MPPNRLSLRLPSALAASALWRGLHEFFAYHGVWAPGVRLLRKLTVRAKVGLVLGIMGAPLLPLSWHVASQQQATVDETSRRLAGVNLAEATVRLDTLFDGMATAIERGHPLPPVDGGPDHAHLVQASDAASQAGLPVLQIWERQRAAIEHALALGAVPAEARPALLHQARQGLADLQHAAAAAAAVDATQDRQLSAQAALALGDLPALQAQLTRVRALAQTRLSADGRTSAAERHTLTLELAAAVATGEHMARELNDRWQAAGGSVSETEAQPEAVAYLALVAHQLLALEPAADEPALHAAHGVARDALHRHQVRLLATVTERLTQQHADAEQLRTRVVALLALTLTLSLYLLYTFFLVMRGGLVQLNHQMNRMAQGDLSARLTPLGVDEVAATMHAMTKSLVRLSDLLASVRHGVSAVTQASQQVAHGNADLSERHHGTVQHIAEVVDGVQRYAAQLEACGRQVEAVVGAVQVLRLESARNRKQMQRLRERMASLRGKSREIGEIVTLIDHIAFRTNILALNASVEASKAGESGRGFAVVAQEVRSLAQRGAESARRIGDIVARSAEDIEQSGQLAEETGNALASADQQVDQIRTAMDDVAGLTRSGEQESAAILTQLTQIKAGGDEGLRLVEQLATASDALRAQGERLAHKVGQFKLS